MAAKKVGHYERWIGTEAERLALTTTGLSPGASFFERDTGLMYRWDGTAWGAASTGGNGDTSSDIQKWGGTTLTGRDVSGDLQALTDETTKGLLKSIGDIGAAGNLVSRIGDTDDGLVDAGAVGSVSAKLRRITNDLQALTDETTKGLFKSVGDIGAGGSLIARVGDTDDAAVDAGAVGTLAAKLRRLSEDVGSIWGWVSGTDTTSAPKTSFTGQTVEEVLTQADATGSPAVTLTFAADIESIEIYHDEEALQTFVVNGITLHVASGGWRSPMGGTAAAVVTIPEAVNCVVTRLV